MMRFDRCTLGAVLLMLTLGLAACSSAGSKQERDAKLEALADSGDWAELETQVQYLESRGEADAKLDYFMGLAQLNQDADRPAEERFGRAVEADSNLALEVAVQYRAAAQRDLEEAWEKRAAQRMRRAYVLDGVTEMGELGGPVSGLLFKDKQYETVIPLLRYLLDTETKTLDLQKYGFALGFSLEETGRPEAALDFYRGYLERWSAGEQSSYIGHVRWRLGVVLLGGAEERMAHGDCMGALELLRELEQRVPHIDHQATLHLRMGLCLEDLNRIDEARQHYESALKYPSGEGGGVHEEARQRLGSLSGSGER